MRWMLCLLVVTTSLVACGRKEAAAPTVLAAAPSVMMRDADVAQAQAPAAKKLAESAGGAEATAPATPRHIELRHNVVVEVPASELEAAWRSQLAACQPPACEVTAANIENLSGELAGASLSLRIVPAKADGLLEGLRGLGRLAQHEMSQNDRTYEVVDIQARLANQKALRDRLRALVAGHQVAKVADLLQVERELARVQGEIDSAEGQLRATLAVTEKVSFDIRFRAPATFSRPGNWEPLREAWQNLGRTFAGSLAGLMYFLAGGLPWFVVLGFVIWGLRWLWQRRKRAASKAA